MYASLVEDVYVKTEGLPFGMNVMGYSRQFLEESLLHSESKVLETGWGRIFDSNKCNSLDLTDVSSATTEEQLLLRFTLDYTEDLQFLEATIQAFEERIYTASDSEIIQMVIERKFYQINEEITETYWANFNKRMNEEQVEKTSQSV
ncbi:hypothetical protein D3C86_1837120 [compost metagenome]